MRNQTVKSYGRCKSGYRTHQQALYDAFIVAMDKHDLFYSKLTNIEIKREISSKINAVITDVYTQFSWVHNRAQIRQKFNETFNFHRLNIRP